MRRLALLLGLTAIMVLGPGGVAGAVPPEHVPVEHIDETFADEEACSFTVLIHVEGDIRHTNFLDQAGNVVRELEVFPGFTVTFTNAETGKSISTVSPSVFHATINPDGSTVAAITGLSGRLGPQAVDVGRAVLFFSGPEDEDPDIIVEVGQFTFGQSLCDVLADP